MPRRPPPRPRRSGLPRARPEEPPPVDWRSVTPAETFAARYPFPLDTFQIDAIEAVEAGMSVLVAAPTGAGKTVIAEFAIQRALDAGRKCFYTTPLKALSNQKFGDLVERHGAGQSASRPGRSRR